MKQTEPIRVVLADDEPLLRKSLAAILSQDEGLQVLGAAGDGRELIRFCEKEKPDVAVVDIQMPIMDGIAAAKWLKRHVPDIKILILTTFNDTGYIKELLAVGIDGYILKGGDDVPFISAVKSVYMGVNTLAPAVLQKLSALIAGGEAPDSQEKNKRGPDTLTDLEKKVAALICKDYFNKDIAAELGVGYGYVRNVVSSIYRKLNITERDLVKEYISQSRE
ncbi:DNA-binding response regulator [Clostridia bacterium]|nr:DNA-binding response regulator [Clostridia bacterium]